MLLLKKKIVVPFINNQVVHLLYKRYRFNIGRNVTINMD